MTKIKAMLFAAGLGTRLKPFTNNHPKALAVVNGKTLLERNILYLKKNGINDLVINVHHFADQIISFLAEHQNFGIHIQVSNESEEVLETGGGLKKAIPLLNDADVIIVMNADILSNLDVNKLLTFHQNKNSFATLAVTERETSRYLLFENEELVGWENIKTGEVKMPKPAEKTNQLAFSGIQVLSKEFLSKILQEGKFSIIETYLSLCATEKINAYNHTGDILIDVGKPEAIEKASAFFE